MLLSMAKYAIPKATIDTYKFVPRTVWIYGIDYRDLSYILQIQLRSERLHYPSSVWCGLVLGPTCYKRDPHMFLLAPAYSFLLCIHETAQAWHLHWHMTWLSSRYSFQGAAIGITATSKCENNGYNTLLTKFDIWNIYPLASFNFLHTHGCSTHRDNYIILQMITN